jgi:hypothetical protein
MNNPEETVLGFMVVCVFITGVVFLCSKVPHIYKTLKKMIKNAVKTADHYESFWECMERPKPKGSETVLDLTGDVKSLERRVKQLECKHQKGHRVFTETIYNHYPVFGQCSHTMGFPMIERCSLCDKEINTYEVGAWKKKELKIAEEKVKELKKRG